MPLPTCTAGKKKLPELYSKGQATITKWHVEPSSWQWLCSTSFKPRRNRSTSHLHNAGRTLVAQAGVQRQTIQQPRSQTQIMLGPFTTCVLNGTLRGPPPLPPHDNNAHGACCHLPNRILSSTRGPHTSLFNPSCVVTTRHRAANLSASPSCSICVSLVFVKAAANRSSKPHEPAAVANNIYHCPCNNQLWLMCVPLPPAEATSN